MSIEKVAQVAKRYQENSKAPLGFVFRDLKTGQTVSHRGDEVFPTASSYKIFILAELFRKVYAGECSLDDRLPLTDEETGVIPGLLGIKRGDCVQQVQNALDGHGGGLLSDFYCRL